MSDLETRSIEQLPASTAVSPLALTAVQEPGGPVQKLQVRQLLGRLISTEEATETEDDLQALLDYDANNIGLVFADPDPAKNGWYRKVGPSGAGNWEQFEKLSADASAEVQALVDAAEAAADLADASATSAATSAAALVVYDMEAASPLDGFYQVTALGAAPSFVEGTLQQAILVDCEGNQDFRMGRCVTSAALRPLLYFDASNGLIGSIDPGTTDETDYSGTTHTTPPDARKIGANSNRFFANGDPVGPISIDLKRTLNVQRTADDARAARDSDIGLVDCAGVTRTDNVYARAYAPAAMPASGGSSVLTVPVTPGERVYFTGTPRRGSPEFCFAMFRKADNTFLSALRQSALGEKDVPLVQEPVDVPDLATSVRFTIESTSAWRIQRAGKKNNAGAEIDEVAALAEDMANGLIKFTESPAPILGKYVQAYSGDLLDGPGNKYIPKQRVRPGQRILVTGRTPNPEFALAVFMNDDVQVGPPVFQGTSYDPPSNEPYYRIPVWVPEGANYVWGSGAGDALLRIEVEQIDPDLARRVAAVDCNSKLGAIVPWLGTSIPATPNPALSISAAASVHLEQVPAAIGSYPQIIADALDMTIPNEGVGSSPMRFGHTSKITEGDIYGIAGLAPANALYALMAPLSIKNDLITNWATYKVIIGGDALAIDLDDNPATRHLGPWGTDFIRSTSYEVRVARNLPPNRYPSAIVIDHGYNDQHWLKADGSYAANRAEAVGSDMATTDIDSRDIGTFFGAVNTLMDYIDNLAPGLPVWFAEHYEDQLNPWVAQAQRMIAAKWSAPLMPLAGKLGWSQELTGDGTMTRHDRALPDLVHPHSDLTGISTMQIARTHTENVRALALLP